MGEPKHPHFYDFGIFGRVPEAQNQLCLSLETTGCLKQSKKIPGPFNMIAISLKLLASESLKMLEKAAAKT